jgi:Asp-tRNA(Asn)/Glu-tRNA(Gln) amidotransferase A subunit family amidase
MSFDGLFDEHDALGLAGLVARREMSARELVEAGLTRIERVDPALNAVTALLGPDDIEAAIALSGSGPFEGVPLMVKQLMADCAGMPTTLGSAFFAREPLAAADSAAVARLRQAGMVIVGRTSTSEFGLAPTAEPRLSGATRNPWDLTLSPGGSSGGAAALVAARAVPLAHATDGGGSIRMPAALCGLYGLKPSRGRVSLAPIGETLAGAGTQLCVSISVRDSAAMLDAISQGEPGDPYGAPSSARSFLAASGRDSAAIRVAVQRRPVGGPDLDPALVRAVDRAAGLLEECGHIVEAATPDYSFAELEDALFTVMAANTWTNLSSRAGGRRFGEDDFEPVTWAYAMAGRAMAASDYIRAVQVFHRIGRRIGAFFERHDILLSPTLARPSLPLGAIRTDGSLDAFRAAMAPMIAFTAVCNVAGIPAASLPLGWTEDGLPLGIQIAGRFGSEETLVSLSGQIERAQPWRQRRPRLQA